MLFFFFFWLKSLVDLPYTLHEATTVHLVTAVVGGVIRLELGRGPRENPGSHAVTRAVTSGFPSEKTV